MAGVPQRATPAFVALFAIATTSCSPWTDVTPSAPLSIDDRLGTVILEVDEPRPVFVSSFFYEGGIYVSAYLGPGYDVDTLESDPTERIVVYRLDPASGEVTQLPDPPFAPGRRHYFTRVLSGSGIMMIAGEDDEEVAYFDGTSWTPRDNHPEYESTTGRLSAWGPNRLYYQRYDGRGVFIQDGGDWRALGPDLSDGTIAHAVAFTDDEIAFVMLRAGELCTQRFMTPTGTPVADATCWDTPATIQSIQANLNGTTNLHRVFAQHDGIPSSQVQLVTIRDGVFEPGPTLDPPRVVSATPGSERLLFRNGDRTYDYEVVEHLLSDGGGAPETAFGPFDMRTECACDRNSDPSCDCVVRAARVGLVSVAPNASQAALLWLDRSDARGRIHVRVIDLPYGENPYRVDMPVDVDAGPPSCDLFCDPWEICLFDTNGRELCWPRDSVPDGGVVVAPPLDAGVDAPVDAGADLGARIAPDVTLTDGALATMDVEGLGDPPAAFALVGDGTQAFEGIPFATYRLTFTGADHNPATMEVTTGAFASSTPVGPHVLSRGLVLGTAPASPVTTGTGLAYLGTVVHPDGDLLVTSDGDDRWLLVRANAGAAPTVTPVAGVTARNMAGTGGAWASAAFTPDGMLALLDTTTGLAAVDVNTGTVVGALSGGPYDLLQIAYAGASSTFVVRDQVTDMLRGIGSAVVASWTATSLTEELRITEPGLHETLRADGAEVARAEPSGSAVIVNVATGAREAIGTIGQHGFAMISPSGRYLLLANRRTSDAAPRPLCWEDFERCQIRVWDRVMPEVRNYSTSSGRFWMSPVADALAFEEVDAVHVEDLPARSRSTIAVTGLFRGHGLGFRDTFTVDGNSGFEVIRVSTATNVLSVPAAGRAFERRFHHHPDGTILVVGGVRIDPSAPSSSILPGSYGRGNIVMGAYQMLSTGSPLSVATLDGATAFEIARGGGEVADITFATIASHGAPCVVYVRDETWAPGTRKLLCGP